MLFGAASAWCLIHRPHESPLASYVLVRFDADDKEARVVIEGEDCGPVPRPLFLNAKATYRVRVGDHEDPAYVPRHERYYVACDGTRLPD